ncbi:hypothetical protein ACVWXO_000057 [Bradyrhizobium sp. LM2.7]
MEGSTFVLYNSNMSITAPAPAIRVYNLFGESRDLPDVVHCETIASRSVLHDWTLAVHRHASSAVAARRRSTAAWCR